MADIGLRRSRKAGSLRRLGGGKGKAAAAEFAENAVAEQAARSGGGGGGGGGGGNYYRDGDEGEKLSEYLYGKVYPGGKGPTQLTAQRKVLGAVKNGLADGGFVAIPYGDNDSLTYYGMAHSRKTPEGKWVKMTPEETLAQVAGGAGKTNEEVLNEHFGGDIEAFARAAKNTQGVAAAVTFQNNRAVNRALQGLSADLASDNPEVRAMALQALNQTEKDLIQRLAPGSAAVPQDGKGGIPDWLPHQKDMPAFQTGLAWAAAAAGAGAGGLAIANLLAAQGAQQQNPVDYAALMQAHNAY